MMDTPQEDTVEGGPDTDLLQFDIPKELKLDMLFLELDRVGRTIELKGTPYVYLEFEDRDLSVQRGVMRFRQKESWLKERICPDAVLLALEQSALSIESVFDAIMRLIEREDIHRRELWILAHILLIMGLKEFCKES